MDDVRKKIIILHNDILKKTTTLDDLLNHKLKKLFKRKSILLPTISDTTKYRYYKKIGHRVLLECESIDNLIISDKSEMDNFKKDACYFELDDKIYLLVLSEEE